MSKAEGKGKFEGAPTVRVMQQRVIQIPSQTTQKNKYDSGG
jgi:hypothetical protein